MLSCRLMMTSLFLCLWLGEKGHGSAGETLEELHTEFAVSLYQTLTETDNSSNLIISPASVSMSLGLLQFGARGNTLSQLEGALRYNSNEIRMQDFLQQVQGDPSNSTQAVRVQLACALFVQSGMQLSQEFTQHASAWANSSVVRTNFSQPNHTRGQVEQWVRSHGNVGDVPALLRGEELAGLVEEQGEPSGWGQTQMALVSSVAFRGTWQRQFLFAETRNLPFTLSDGTTTKVPMMYQASEVKFGQFRTPTDHRYTVVELPYLGDSLSLLVALPSERKLPLALLETQLSSRAVALWASGLRRAKMDVFLPRFRIQSRFNLKSVLLSLGISDIFDPMAADFGGISEDGLYVSEAIHEAKIEVTEEGTKAAAATAMVLLKRSRAPVFKADRPFIFLLREASTGSVLFMGRVVNPAGLA
ncbi:probable serpin E3 [Conger conger]|uniref:probable serpin E3 n=1 Tax=Conger conger TaxID=82655 RepID=UPI002A59A521|nr:probable serpin E3 [Conger conger]